MTVPMLWSSWSATHATTKHAGGFSPELRLSEPNVPDVVGVKYVVADAESAKVAKTRSLPDAVALLLSRENTSDTVRAAGSDRPIVEWRRREGVHDPLPSVVWVGCSIVEARAVAALLPQPRGAGREMLTLRIRVRRRVLERIKHAAEHDRVKHPDGTPRDRNLSNWCLAALVSYTEAYEALLAAQAHARATGQDPSQFALVVTATHAPEPRRLDDGARVAAPARRHGA